MKFFTSSVLHDPSLFSTFFHNSLQHLRYTECCVKVRKRKAIQSCYHKDRVTGDRDIGMMEAQNGWTIEDIACINL